MDSRLRERANDHPLDSLRIRSRPLTKVAARARAEAGSEIGILDDILRLAGLNEEEKTT